jgi:SSS family solute:Na+ symporter
MWSAGLSNLLNVTLIYFGIIMASIVSVRSLGGMAAIQMSLPAEVPYMNLVDGLGWGIIMAWIVVMATQSQSCRLSSRSPLAPRTRATPKRALFWADF